MINVGIDTWHFRSISGYKIDFCRTTIESHYDYNVFSLLIIFINKKD